MFSYVCTCRHAQWHSHNSRCVPVLVTPEKEFVKRMCSETWWSCRWGSSYDWFNVCFFQPAPIKTPHLTWGQQEQEGLSASLHWWWREHNCGGSPGCQPGSREWEQGGSGKGHLISTVFSSGARGGRREGRLAEVAQELHPVHHCVLGSHWISVLFMLLPQNEVITLQNAACSGNTNSVYQSICSSQCYRNLLLVPRSHLFLLSAVHTITSSHYENNYCLYHCGFVW